MPEYVKIPLDGIQHPKPKIPQYAPYRWTVLTDIKILHIAPYIYDGNII